jgi:hypothetical protein
VPKPSIMDLRSHFSNPQDNIQFPKWLSRADREINLFYGAMKLWEKLCPDPDMTNLSPELCKGLPAFKSFAPYFPRIVEYCEAHLDLLPLLRTALIGLTRNSFAERQGDIHLHRYDAGPHAVTELFKIPESTRYRRPRFLTEASHVDKALADMVKKIFLMVFQQMKNDGQNDHIPHLVYNMVHIANADAQYCRSAKRAMHSTFCDAYLTMTDAEKIAITHTNPYRNNHTARALIDDAISDARTQMAYQNVVPLTRSQTL